MTAQDGLLIALGIVFGWAMGYLQAWRFARRLEHHEVVLAEWDADTDLSKSRGRASVTGIDSARRP